MKEFVADIQEFTVMTGRTIWYGLYGHPRYVRLVFDEMYFIGVGSLLIVALIGSCVGVIWALQISTELAAFGAKLYLGKMTSPAIVRVWILTPNQMAKPRSVICCLFRNHQRRLATMDGCSLNCITLSESTVGWLWR